MMRLTPDRVLIIGGFWHLPEMVAASQISVLSTVAKGDTLACHILGQSPTRPDQSNVHQSRCRGPLKAASVPDGQLNPAAPGTARSRLFKNLASLTVRGPRMLHGSSSPSFGRIGIRSSRSHLYMYAQNMNSGIWTASCAPQTSQLLTVAQKQDQDPPWYSHGTPSCAKMAKTWRALASQQDLMMPNFGMYAFRLNALIAAHTLCGE